MNKRLTTVGEKATMVDLTPQLGDLTRDYINFCRLVKAKLKVAKPAEQNKLLETLRNNLINDDLVGKEQLALLFAQNVILDLIALGWELNVRKSAVLASPPNFDKGAKHATKEITRKSHLLGRDAQLREKPVRDFILGMERRRLTSKGWHSIYSVMRDGKDLAEKLQQIVQINDEGEKLDELSKTILPYLQFVEPDALCSQTGLRLGDIWRYFRHTWVNEYKSIPGRSMMILIRDAAIPNHPVIGIAALGSSVVQHRIRDEWIGWQSETLAGEVAQKPTKKLERWLVTSLERLISSIYIKDLKAEGLLTKRNLNKPTSAIVELLLNESLNSIKEHRKEPQRTKHNGQKNSRIKADFWEKEAKTFLYRSKRCKQLSKLLNIRLIFQENGFGENPSRNLREILAKSKVRNAVAQLIRMVKAEHVGVDMMDITVCGAVAPYSPLLGGKLVCMLLCSPEVTQYHAKRYAEQISIIASAMKGAPVTRKPNLVLLCTTSLYGVGSSQYNRVKIPLRELGLNSDENVSYKDLGHSYGFGTYHFSRTTIQLGANLNARKKGGRRVNSIFGEGVNPLMRKIRESLELVGLNSEKILQHGNQRVTYGIQLATNFREILLGINEKPRYLMPQTNVRSQTEKIADYWQQRWLLRRISSNEVLLEAAKNAHSYPINHQARVTLPISDEDFPLFDEGN